MSMMPNHNLKEGVDYDLLPYEKDESAWVIRVKSGVFEGMLLQYFSVQIEEHDDGTANLKYVCDVLEGDVSDMMQAEFNQLTTDILHAIINGFLEDSPEAIKFEDENGQELGDYAPPTSS